METITLPSLKKKKYSDKELEKRLQAIRIHLRKLEDIDEESMLSENEEIELNYMTDVIMQIINNDTETACISEDESSLPKEELKEFIEMLYDISTTVYFVSVKYDFIFIHKILRNTAHSIRRVKLCFSRR